MNDNLVYFEKRLMREIEEIEARIKELEAERRTLTRQLAKARADREGLKFTTRKNSVNRVLAENAILEALRSKKGPQSTRALYIHALGTNYTG